MVVVVLVDVVVVIVVVVDVVVKMVVVVVVVVVVAAAADLLFSVQIYQMEVKSSSRRFCNIRKLSKVMIFKYIYFYSKFDAKID